MPFRESQGESILKKRTFVIGNGNTGDIMKEWMRHKFLFTCDA